VVDQQDQTVGFYEGRTGFGVSVEVEKINRKRSAIFDKFLPINAFKYGFLPEKPRSSPPLQSPSTIESIGVKFRLSMDREEAKRILPELHAAFMVELREPFVVQINHKPYSLTRDHPRDIDEHATILFGDI